MGRRGGRLAGISPDVPGLATGAESLDALVDKLRTVVPDLLIANGVVVDR